MRQKILLHAYSDTELTTDVRRFPCGVRKIKLGRSKGRMYDFIHLNLRKWIRGYVRVHATLERDMVYVRKLLIKRGKALAAEMDEGWFRENERVKSSGMRGEYLIEMEWREGDNMVRVGDAI